MCCPVLIEGSNSFHPAQQLGFGVDCARLLSVFLGRVLDSADRWIEPDQLVERFRKENGTAEEDGFRERL
jgi:hypothetical protein